MPSMHYTCADCGRSRSYRNISFGMDDLDDIHAWMRERNEWTAAELNAALMRTVCKDGCKPAPGKFWDRLGQSSLHDIFVRHKLFRAREVFDD